MKRLTRILVAVFLILSVSSSSLTFDKISIENYSKSESLAFNTTQKSTTRNIKNIAVFIEFSDSDTNVVNHLDDEQSVNNANLIYNSDTLFLMDSVKGIISVPSFKKYFERESYGKLSITTEIFPKVDGKVVSYQDTHPIGYYLKQNEGNPIGYKDKNEGANREKELINNAVRYIKNQVVASGITASDLDTDGDNKIDAISFIIEGQKKLPSSIAWGDILWSHESSNTGITEQILGKDVNAYTLLRADDYTEVASLFSLNHGGYGTIIHEFGHVLGFRDLYRYGNSNSKPVGFYDIMGNAIGSNPQSFLTYFTSEFSSAIRWHNPIPVINKSTENITLFKPNFIDANEKRAIKIQIPGITNEYFIVEYHEKLNTYESYSADLMKINDTIRLSELFNDLNFLDYLRTDDIKATEEEILSCGKYATSIAKAYSLFIEYIKGTPALRKYILNCIQNVFDGNMQLEDILDEFEITFDSCFEDQKLLKYFCH